MQSFLIKGYPTLKKYWLLNLKLAEVQTGKIFHQFFGGHKLIIKNEIIFQKAFI